MSDDHNRAPRDRVRLLGGMPAIAGGGEPPHDDGMEQRVATLEIDVKDMKAGISRLELGQATILAKLEGLASAADLAILGGQFVGLQERMIALSDRMAAQSERMTKIETAMTDTVKMALSKTIGVAGAVGLFVSMAAVVTAIATVLHALHMT